MSSTAVSKNLNHSIPSSLFYFLEKRRLKSDEIHRISLELVFMPFKQEGSTQSCYAKITKHTTVNSLDGKLKTADFARWIYNEIEENLNIADQTGHNAYFTFDIKAQVEYTALENGNKIKFSSTFEAKREGSFLGESRSKLLGGIIQPKPKSLLLLDGLDLATDVWQSKSADDRQMQLLMP